MRHAITDIVLKAPDVIGPDAWMMLYPVFEKMKKTCATAQKT